MARNRGRKNRDRDKSKDHQPADEQPAARQDKEAGPGPAAKMGPTKRTAEVMTDPIVEDGETSDLEGQPPARRQRTAAHHRAAEGDSKPRFATRLLSPSKQTAIPQTQPWAGGGGAAAASAVAPSHPLNAPHITSLSQKYRFESVTVSRNCKMDARIGQITKLLQQQQSPQEAAAGSSALPLVVAVSAREDAVNKAVGVVEIAKRDRGWYQYTAAWSRLERLPSAMEAKFGPGRKLSDGTVVPGHEDGDGGGKEGGDGDRDMADAGVGVDAADLGENGSQHFQVMEEVQRAKVRSIAMITMYLSREPVMELRKLLGEQT